MGASFTVCESRSKYRIAKEQQAVRDDWKKRNGTCLTDLVQDILVIFGPN
jgi:hypothetical protein